MKTDEPGPFFHDHPAAFGVALTGAAGAALAFGVRARFAASPRKRVGWAVAAVLQAAQVGSIWRSRSRLGNVPKEV